MPCDAQHWEDVYSRTDPETLPWNAGGPDPDLVRLVVEGTIPVGQALDIGTGPGHDAVFLIQHGFNVIAIDISPSAVKLARENASAAGLFGFFQQGDIRQIPVEDHFVDFTNDRGCFHVLDAPDRPKAVAEVHRVLRKGGLYLLHVFSDKEPPSPGLRPPSPDGRGAGGEGPHRFTRKELDDLFAHKFKTLQIWEGVFEGPRKPKSYSMLMEKK
jgi:SAM-dependent methyltransferase